MSGNGRVVVGQLNSNGYGFIWTEGRGIAVFTNPLLPGGTGAPKFSGVSHDGSVVVGSDQNAAGNVEAFRWVRQGAVQPLGFLPGGLSYSEAYGISGDGAAVIGRAQSGPNESALFRWSAGSGMEAISKDSFLGIPVMSSDGSAIIVLGAGGYTLYHTVTQPLTIPWHPFADFRAISGDGDLVVGASHKRPRTWRRSTGEISELPIFLQSSESYGDAYAVSGNGMIIVGRSDGRACFWRHGRFYYLDSFLTSLGTDLGSWKLESADGVSSDGSAIYGSGINPAGFRDAWHVRLGTDADGDGVLDADDLRVPSDLRKGIEIGSLSTGVTNTLLPSGCSIADLLHESADRSHSLDAYRANLGGVLEGLIRCSVLTLDHCEAIYDTATVVSNAAFGVSTPSGANVLRINAGGNRYVDRAGNVWEADFGFSTGEKADPESAPILWTVDDPIYQTERWDPAGGEEMAYSFALPNGTYLVRLHFAEVYNGVFLRGGRVFNVWTEGTLSLAELDIFREVGANAALIREMVVTVNDERLDIHFGHVVENPKISAIEVFQHSPGP